jgi:hypothetical protein
VISATVVLSLRQVFLTLKTVYPLSPIMREHVEAMASLRVCTEICTLVKAAGYSTDVVTHDVCHGAHDTVAMCCNSIAVFMLQSVVLPFMSVISSVTPLPADISAQEKR